MDQLEPLSYSEFYSYDTVKSKLLLTAIYFAQKLKNLSLVWQFLELLLFWSLNFLLLVQKEASRKVLAQKIKAKTHKH